MKCARCGYFNIPGSETCGRCGVSLTAAASPAVPLPFDELYPPRARDRTLKTRVRRPLERATRPLRNPAVIDAATAFREQVVEWDWRPWLISSCAVLPGVVQLFQKRFALAAILMSLTAVLILGIVVTIHLVVSNLLMWAALAACAFSVWDVADRCFPGWIARDSAAEEAKGLRAIRLAWVAIGIVAMTAVGFFGVMGREYDFWVFRNNTAAPSFLRGDGLLVQHRDAGHPLQRGEVVVYSGLGGGDGFITAPRAERILGMAGDTIATRGNTFLVNGVPLPPERMPLAARLPLPPVNFVVPPGQVCFWRSVVQVDGEGNGPLPYDLIAVEQVRGRAIAIYQPPARRRWFH